MKHMTSRLLTVIVAAGLVLGVSAPAHASAPTPAGMAPSQHYNFQENFDKTAAVGAVDSTYPNSWQPYPNGMSGKYYSDDIISTHGGNMDLYFGNGAKGAAGTFGTANGAWGHVGGTFSIRMKQVGGASEGVAVLVWPSSDKWGDGELDAPEGYLNGDTQIFHHKMAAGQESQSYQYNMGNKWNDWHTYTVDWKPGSGGYVKYYLDDKLVFTNTSDVPTTAHRYMIQTGNHGKGGHLVIDWVRTTE
jgi:hypothetical protein